MTDFIEKPDSEGQGPVKMFLEHLEDLRWVLVKILIVISVSWMACFYLGPKILLVLQKPLEWSGVADPSKFLRVFSPSAAFAISFQLALYAGLILSAPIILYFIGSFVIPALTRRERGFIVPAFWLGSGFFLAGVLVCYFWALPLALKVSREFTHWLNIDVEFWTVDSYVSFATKFILGMGVAFEIPLIIMSLVYFGILDYQKLSRARRYVIILNFILGAVLTTPEVFTQLLMAIPLTVMYEVCIWIAWFMDRKKRKSQKLEVFE